MNSTIVKRCACGRPYNRHGWQHLPLVGDQPDGGQVLELRNCICGSTLALPKESP